MFSRLYCNSLFDTDVYHPGTERLEDVYPRRLDLPDEFIFRLASQVTAFGDHATHETGYTYSYLPMHTDFSYNQIVPAVSISPAARLELSTSLLKLLRCP